MSELQGTIINSNLVPTDSLDEYYLLEDMYLKGGWRSVADITERDAIYSSRRKEGMVVAVNSEGKVYQLVGGVTNSDWVEFSSGGSISGDLSLYTLLSTTASISGALDTRIDKLEEINDNTGEPTGFVNRTSSTLSFNNTNRTFTITGTHEVYCDGVKYTFGTTSQQINNTHGVHFIYYNPSGVWTYSDGVPWSINGGDAMVAAIYWDAINQLGVLVEERHGCIMDASTHYYNHNLFGTQRITAGAISGYTIQTNSNASVQVAVGATTLADEDITYTTVSNLIAGSYRFARRSGTGSAWVVAETNTNPFIVATNNIEFNELNGSTWQMTEVTTNNTYVNYYIVASTTVDGTYSYLLVPGQATYGSLALAQGESFNNLNLTGFPFIEFNALYQLTFRYNNAYNNITGQARLEAEPVLLGLRSATQVVAPVSTHNSLSGLQGGAVGEYFHLTSAQSSDFIGKSEVANISGNLQSQIQSLDSSIDIQVFTEDGTWNAPSGSGWKEVEVMLIGGGTGGVSGRTVASGVGVGGTGGIGGAYIKILFDYDYIISISGSSIPVTVGAGGLGGVANGTSNVVGGQYGGNTNFGNPYPNSIASATGTLGLGGSQFRNTQLGSGGNGAAGGAGSSGPGPGQGGGGAGIASDNTTFSGGAGGTSTFVKQMQQWSNILGSPSTERIDYSPNTYFPGKGGPGGVSSATTVNDECHGRSPTDGYGGGGGGGGVVRSGVGGNGGNGRQGVAVITCRK